MKSLGMILVGVAAILEGRRAANLELDDLSSNSPSTGTDNSGSLTEG
jgi:hypothetical protein